MSYNKIYSRINWVNNSSPALNETNLNAMDYAISTIDDRVVELDISKATQSDLNESLKSVTYDTTKGIFTFTYWNDTQLVCDLNIEKIPVSFSMSEDGVITMKTSDGTEWTCDIKTLIKQYTFTDTDTIDFTDTTDADGNHTVKAEVVKGSITQEYLNPDYLASITTSVNTAESYKNQTVTSASNASASSLVSEGWAKGTQNGVEVEDGSPYYHNNSKYYMEQAQSTSGIGNGTVTIKQGDDVKGTFTLNQADDVTITLDEGGGAGAQLKILVESGSLVSVTNGTKTKTATSADGQAFVDVGYGTWTITCSKEGRKTATQSVEITEAKQYEVTVNYFHATIKVSTDEGVVLTFTKGSISDSVTTTSTTYAYDVYFDGEWTVTAEKDVETLSEKVTVLEEKDYDVSFTFASITVTTEVGSSIVIKKDDTVIATKVSTGEDKFGVGLGTYTVTCSLNSKSTTETVEVTENKDYPITVGYYKVLTANIDLTNSNPATCITLADDAVGMTKDEIKAWFGHYPCLFKNGEEIGRLRPSNYTKFEYSNQDADITSGNNGDVMVAFPRRGLKINTVGNTLSISFTDNPNDSNFEYNAHTRGTTAKDVFYLGAYKGYSDGSKLRSLSGKTPTAGKTIGEFRTLAQANGSGYEQSAFYQLTYRQAMYILCHQNLNSQSAVGMGYVLYSHTACATTGNTNAYGMDSEIIKASNPAYMTDRNHQVKCLGLEDFWGNIWEWIDGLVTDSTRNVLTANSGFNDSGSGYTNNGQGATANIGNYMSKPQGTTKTGFVAKEVSGSGSTYFCDYASLSASCVAKFGGIWYAATLAGAFQLNVTDAASYSAAYVAARLMYL